MVSVSSKRLDHLKAKERYKAYRELAYENAMSKFSGVTAKGIEFVDGVIVDAKKIELGLAFLKYMKNQNKVRVVKS